MDTNRTIKPYRFELAAILLLLVLVLASPAYAFRCGNKIVIENMHELQVRKACGEPTTIRHLGFAVRGIDWSSRRSSSSGFSNGYFPGFGHLVQEVVVTEYVYNLGPRKFMRRLVFEGGILVSIEAIGYGYH
ncbi:MAG: DUF2845 domain-containing protein [Gammaproteobacteria bacterium]|nr:DUF2845 domain-containing protein [Gammaproteobacteria bacterium]MDH3362809.1 DUF2845 domain-containing protein [Gammaproteobacteria bacterium]MDH3480516.1 DUF2845 domain-containing protein [Gammaproteobacteria bacterium]